MLCVEIMWDTKEIKSFILIVHCVIGPNLGPVRANLGLFLPDFIYFQSDNRNSKDSK